MQIRHATGFVHLIFRNKNTKISKVETGMVIKNVTVNFTANEMQLRTVENKRRCKVFTRYSYFGELP